MANYVKNGKNRKAYDPELDRIYGKKGVDTAFDFFTQLFPDCEFAINEAEKNGNFKDVFDLTIKIRRKVLNIEINLKKMWIPEPELVRRGERRIWTIHESGEYPFVWDTMDYLERKNDDGGRRNPATHHLTVGGDKQRVFLNPRKNIDASPIGDKWCRNTKQMEPHYFWALPAPGSGFYEKNKKGTWKPIAVFDAKGNKK